MAAIAFGLLASLCFAVASLLAQRGLHTAPTPWGAWITVAVNAVALSLCHYSFEPAAPILAAENLTFVAVGLFVPGLTRVLTFRGIRAMGSAITSTIVNTTPMFSTALAILILRERPGPLVLVGAVLIVAGLVAISWEGENRSWHRTELVYPFLASLMFAAKDVAVRWGLAESGAPALAAAIAAVTSTAAIFALLSVWQREKFSLPPVPALYWFIASGLFTGGSFFFMYLALSMERVSIIGPLVNSYAVFVLLLAPLIARRIETVTLWKVTGAALVVAGIFAISAGRAAG
jgi:drug/metabolite transporter (DMT)-like permease